MKAVRDSRFEFLRILSMLMIIMQHPLERCMPDGFYGMISAPFSFNYVCALALMIWGQLGVMLFVMISAWFMADRKGISGKKVILLLLQTCTICIGMMLVFAVVHPESLSLKLMIKELLTPVNKNHYWFVTTFLAFYCSVPLLQFLVQKMDDRQLRSACIVVVCLIPLYNYLYENPGSTWADFCCIFLVTAYLKRTPDNWLRKNRRLFPLGLLIITGTLIMYKLLFEPKLGTDLMYTLFKALRGRTLLLLLTAFGLFYCVEAMKPFFLKWVNTLGSAMFGVYLLHENYLIRGEENGSSFLWNTVLRIDEKYLSSSTFLLQYIGIVLVVFASCIVIELLRQNLVERWYRSGKLITKLGNWFDTVYGKIL